jgi:2-keto-4-pentenoate hydratase/2-oxohepta-3-ene-1,7-dioic acid hydratase in catechol pathway
MGISLVRYVNKSGEATWGAREGEAVRPLATQFGTLKELLRSSQWQMEGNTLPANTLEYLSPVTAPCQIICQGKNYLDHLLETGVRPQNKDFNLLFSKADSSLNPPAAPVIRPPQVELLDYELELGLVMKRDLAEPTTITEANLPDYVAGFVIANDVSARDVQVPQRQWLKGKSFRTFCPVGPVLYLPAREEFQQLLNLELHLTVNGETRQKANTKQLMHRPAETLTEISSIFTMRTGDLLLTGTPGGVAMKVKSATWLDEFRGTFKSEKEKFKAFVEEQKKSPRYLKPGDRVEGTIRSADGKIDLGRQAWTVG